MEIHSIAYASWKDFVRDYKNDLFSEDVFQNLCLYRGQSDSEWDLTSSFDRLYGNENWKMRTGIEKDLLNSFKSHCSRIVSDSPIAKLETTQLMNLAQHYGIPTRLLDWSYSPFVAAYFAFASIDGRYFPNAGNVAIWVLYKSHELWNSNIGVQIVDELLPHNDHQKRQLGCFTILNNQSKSINQFVESCSENGKDIERALLKLSIPKTEQKIALSELDAMNINASTIFGGYEGCAKAACAEMAMKYF